MSTPEAKANGLAMVLPERGDLGGRALLLAAAGPALMLLGLVGSLLMGFLFPLPLYAAAVSTVPLSGAALITGAVSVATNRGRWKGLLAALASLPVGALGVLLAIPLVEWVTSLIGPLATWLARSI